MDQIIDGRNRYLACVEVGVDPVFRAYEGSDPLRFVIDQNINRRHLGTAQRALIAAQMVTSSHGGDRKSDQAANLPVVTQSSAAALLNVSERTVRDMNSILASGRQDIIDLVKSGELSVHGAMTKPV